MAETGRCANIYMVVFPLCSPLDFFVFLWNEAENSSIIDTTLFSQKTPKLFEYGRLYCGSMMGGLVWETMVGCLSEQS